MADNRIVLENARTDGRMDRSYWDAASSKQIEGFARDFSVNAGHGVDFSVNVNGGAGSDYKVEIFRLGYYGGSGAREVASWVNTDAKVQPNALYDPARGLKDAGNWSITDHWDVPADAVSGVYLARLQRLDAAGNPVGGATNQIPFVVRNDGVAADVVLQTSDTTWQAYNGWFGNNGQVGANFYGDASGTVSHPAVADPGGGAQNRAYAVSYNRPFITRDGTSPASGPQDYLFGADYAAVSWLEKNGYSTSYISGVDTDRLGADYLKNYKAFISVGHDEYWSGGQRANVEAARDAGVNLLFWSGNEVYWKTRWETSISADGTPYRTLVCYKETWANGDPNAGPEDYANIDPSNTWTGTWRDVRFLAAQDAAGNYIAGGTAPDPISGLYPNCHCAETQLTGQLFLADDAGGGSGAALNIPAGFGGLRVWRGTAATDGEMNVAPGVLGYEWDVSPDDANRPAGLIKLSETTVDWSSVLQDQGNRTAPGRATHNLTLYRDPESGALVFASGTVFWSWGLSNQHDSSPYGATIESALLKQFAVNMFADMDIQPGSLDPLLKVAVKSTDITGARADMVDLPAQVAALSTLTLTGTATDNDGIAATTDGRVALVEVSLDGGQTWKAAQGTTNWSYQWRPTVQGTYDIRVRAIDDSLNVTGLTLDQDTVTVTAPPRPATFSLFDPGVALPAATRTYNDGQSLELGMRFNVSEAGTVTQLKYYRGTSDAGDTDVREGHLWRASDGALLGTVTFTSTAGQSGWQVANLSVPVGLVAGVDYIVSYKTANNYVATEGFFAPANDVAFDGLDDNAFSDPFVMVHAPQDTGTGVAGNGVYEYGTGLVVPSNTYRATNYWTDVTFRPNPTAPNSPPVFATGDFTVAENSFAVGTVQATDANSDALTYAIAGGADAALFNLNASTGALTFKVPPNFEAPGDVGADNIYDLRLSVTDGLSAAVFTNVQVRVTDVNDAPVALVLSNATVSEAATAGQVVGALMGTDPDSGDTLTYRLVDSEGGRFVLSGNQLVVAVGAALNREAAASYSVTVRVTDADGASLDKSFGIELIDVDEFDVTKPVDGNTAANVVNVGAAAGTTVGITALASDGDATTNTITYSLTDDAGGRFVVNPTSGVVTVATGASFSTSTPSHQIIVMATSADGSTASETLQVNVTEAARLKVTLTNGSDIYTAPDNRSYEVQGLSGSDSITTLGGNDLVNGGAGNDTISTGEGQDIIEVTGTTAGEDAINGGAGTDLLRATVAGTLIRLSSLSGIEQISANGLANVKVVGTGAANTFDLAGVTLTGITAIDMASGNDTLVGSAGHDTILGGSGTDSLDGGAGNDVIDGGTSSDVLNGGLGDDRFLIGPSPGTDQINGGGGLDTVEIGTTGITVSVGNLANVEVVTTTFANVTLSGTAGADVISYAEIRWSGLTLVDGGAGNDTILGGPEGDRLAGRAGADSLSGGAGEDDFVYFAATDSRGTTADTILGFDVGLDDIDLSAIDANSLVTGNQDFTFIGDSAFSRVAGQLRADTTSVPGQTRIFADINGDGRADMEIRLDATLILTRDDFVL
ncbi:N,N-dimethylformamidase beta subunit family domain-containing protein [Rubellimicrobium arenae]|uniref:N,N-dimethylformamidase beta subunit family domain-containing protein n=1 Tax=Rubellimicrobium arenae TaxID=2817372 RepID=UPI001B30B6AC|nr:N,N-dimethylformamidase beta subunit family domain-containing protein [Rubellimicrobium arenae]